MMIKRRSYLIVAALLCAGAALALRAQPQSPSVDQILAKYISSTGGEQNWRKFRTRISKGRAEISGQAVFGTADFYYKAPNKYLYVVSLAEMGEIRRGFNGTAGWEKLSDSAATDVTGQELATLQRSADFYQALDIRKLYDNLALAADGKVEGTPAFVIEAKTSDGTSRRMYFDKDSGLMLKNEEDFTAEGQRVHIETEYQDFRDVDGIKYPFLLIQTNAASTVLIRVQSIQHDQTIDDAVFEKPKV
jgi:zinc protease